LTPACVAAVRTPRTRAVLPVHLYGHVVPFEHLAQMVAEGLVVVEDAAQAHLGTDGGRSVGTVAHAACFSFFPGKNLGALGDGGMVVSDDTEILDAVRRARDHGRVAKYEHAEIGWSSRLDGLQAAFLEVKLGHLAKWTANRQAMAQVYRSRLENGAAPGVSLVPWREGDVHHLLVVRVSGASRDALAATLADAGISAGIHYPVPLSRQPALREWAEPTPHAERAADQVLSLPMDPLMTEIDVHTVCDAVVAWATAGSHVA
jgi:dTDP-4-amino-4,6-dideoxygalactose transaminase